MTIVLQIRIKTMLKTPICQLTVDNKPLNDLIQKRIISVHVTDNRADEADELSITLDDSDGKLELPKRGVKINCQLGFVGEGIHDKGDFIVDEVEWGGSPDTITIKASSANFKSSAKSAKSASFHQTTLGTIAQKIAQNNNLKLNITPELASIKIQHSDQTNESDLNYIKRLAKQIGAEMAVKKDQLLIFIAGTAQTASGKPLPTLTITRQSGDGYRYSEQDRDSDYTGVSAYYREDGKKTRQRVTSGNTEQYGGGDDTSTTTKVLKCTFASKEEAERAAGAAMQSKNRKMAKFSITTAFGIPQASTESPVKLQGFKAQIDGLNWIIEKATHSYSTSGLTTALELEASV